MSPRRQAQLAFLALIGGATGIGFAPILVRLADTGPSATAFYRVLFALPLLWLWSGNESRKNPAARRPTSPKDIFLLAMCGLLFAADLSIWHWSIRLTTVANSTLLANLAPIFVMIGARLFLQEPITLHCVAGMGMAMAGSCLLLGSSLQLGGSHLRGDMVAIIAAVFYGGYLLMVRHLRRQFPTPILIAWTGLFSCPAFGLIALLSGDAMWTQSSQTWLALVALALVSHVGGQTLIIYGFGHLPASFSSVSLLWQPVVAAAAAWLFLREPLDWSQGFGGLIVLAGIAVAGGMVPSWRLARPKSP